MRHSVVFIDTDLTRHELHPDTAVKLVAGGSKLASLCTDADLVRLPVRTWPTKRRMVIVEVVAQRDDGEFRRALQRLDGAGYAAAPQVYEEEPAREPTKLSPRAPRARAEVRVQDDVVSIEWPLWVDTKVRRTVEAQAIELAAIEHDGVVRRGAGGSLSVQVDRSVVEAVRRGVLEVLDQHRVNASMAK